MIYVALLRARRVLLRYGIFLLIVFGLAIASLLKAQFDGHGHTHFAVSMSNGVPNAIPFVAIFAGAACLAYLIVPALGANLDADYRTAAIAFTRPMSRYAVALRSFVMGAAAFAVAVIMTAVVGVSFMGAVGAFRYVSFTADGADLFALVCAVAVMWYGWVVFAAALFPGRGNAMIGISWGFALVMPGLSAVPFPDVVHQVLHALTFLDPVAYLGSFGSDSHGSDSVLGISSIGVRTLTALVIGIVAIAAGTRIWATREVTA